MDICGCCGQQKSDVIEVELQQGGTYGSKEAHTIVLGLGS
jgi:hypothetical protein